MDLPFARHGLARPGQKRGEHGLKLWDLPVRGLANVEGQGEIQGRDTPSRRGTPEGELGLGIDEPDRDMSAPGLPR